MRKITTSLLMPCLLLMSINNAIAKPILVKTLAELQTAINIAAPGDVITVANGIYTTTENITIRNNGTASQPITIMAQKQGGAEIRGTGGFSIESPSSYIVIQGFTFTHASDKA